jgi:hypothetical protein
MNDGFEIYRYCPLGHYSCYCVNFTFLNIINPWTPNGHYSGRTAPLTSRRCILNIYSTNIRTEYFERAA